MHNANQTLKKKLIFALEKVLQSFNERQLEDPRFDEVWVKELWKPGKRPSETMKNLAW